QNSNFEFDQFAAHLVEKIRMPLSNLKLGIETSSYRDSSLKATIEKPLGQMMEVFNEFNLPHDLAELVKLERSLSPLPDHVQSLHSGIHSYPLVYRYEENHNLAWVAVEVMRLKPALQLLFRELLKLLEDSAEAELHARSQRD